MQVRNHYFSSSWHLFNWALFVCLEQKTQPWTAAWAPASFYAAPTTNGHEIKSSVPGDLWSPWEVPPPHSGMSLMERSQNADKPAEFTCTKISPPLGNPQRRLPAAAPPPASAKRPPAPRSPAQHSRRGCARERLPFSARGPASHSSAREPAPPEQPGEEPRIPRAPPARARRGCPAPPLTAPGGARSWAATLTPPSRPCCLAGLRLSRDGGAGRAAEEARGGAAPPRGEKAGAERHEAMRSGGNYKNKQDVIFFKSRRHALSGPGAPLVPPPGFPQCPTWPRGAQTIGTRGVFKTKGFTAAPKRTQPTQFSAPNSAPADAQPEYAVNQLNFSTIRTCEHSVLHVWCIYSCVFPFTRNKCKAEYCSSGFKDVTALHPITDQQFLTFQKSRNR